MTRKKRNEKDCDYSKGYLTIYDIFVVFTVVQCTQQKYRPLDLLSHTLYYHKAEYESGLINVCYRQWSPSSVKYPSLRMVASKMRFFTVVQYAAKTKVAWIYFLSRSIPSRQNMEVCPSMVAIDNGRHRL